MTALTDAVGALETSVAKNASDIAALKNAVTALQTTVAGMSTPASPPTQPPPIVVSDMANIAASLGYASTRLKWNELFAGTTLDSTKWIPQIADQNGIWRKTVPAPLSAGDSGGFDSEYFDPAQVVVNNGLQLIAQPSLAYAGYAWKSGCICTHGKWSFPSGLLLVKMKQPDCRSGMWPGIWMLEGGGEIDLQEGGYIHGATSPNNVMAANLHVAGANQIQNDVGVDLSADYHIYGVNYQPGKSVTISIDGKTIASYASSVPTGAYTLLLDLQVATNNAAGWHTVYSASTPNPSVMRVAGVQWYQ